MAMMCQFESGWYRNSKFGVHGWRDSVKMFVLIVDICSLQLLHDSERSNVMLDDDKFWVFLSTIFQFTWMIFSYQSNNSNILHFV